MAIVLEVHDLIEIIRDLRAGKVPTHNELVILGDWANSTGSHLPIGNRENFRAALRRLHSGKPLFFYDHQLLDELLEEYESRRRCHEAAADAYDEHVSRRQQEGATPWQT
jgi:hypothetical protein